jgi:peptidoglycan hydrolase-like protein with peptidoglycan-binding domain
MTNKYAFRNRILVSLFILSLCMSMAVPALAYEDTTLYNGCRGEGVRAMQQALINLGYLHGSAVGIFGIQTEEAVRAFQRSNGLTADGLAGTRTLSALGSAPNSGSAPAAEAAAPAAAPAQAPVYKDTTLYNGCSGEEVRALQQALIDLGYFKGTADGRFGDQTEEAVRAFQQNNGLTPDGLAGTKTRSALESARNGSNAAFVQGFTPAPATEAEETRWETLDRKAVEILQKEGHSTDGLNYIEHFYSPKSQNKSRDYYSVTFYRSAKDSKFDWVHAIQFSADGQMYKMYTRTAERQNNTNNNDPTTADADSNLLSAARQAAKAYMERYGYSSLAGLASRMQLNQISVSQDKKETYYSFVGPGSEFLITIRVAPSVRVDYFYDQR